jgi:hypothetical protein
MSHKDFALMIAECFVGMPSPDNQRLEIFETTPKNISSLMFEDHGDKIHLMINGYIMLSIQIPHATHVYLTEAYSEIGTPGFYLHIGEATLDMKPLKIFHPLDPLFI